MPQQISRGAHALPALGLEFRNEQAHPVAAGHLDPLLASGENGAGCLGAGSTGGGAVDLKGRPGQLRRGAGPGLQAPDLTVDGPGAAAPVDGREFLAEHGRVGHLGLVLGRADGSTIRQGRNGLGERLGTQLRQPVPERGQILLGADGGPGHPEHVAGVQRLGYIHDGHAGLRLVI